MTPFDRIFRLLFWGICGFALTVGTTLTATAQNKTQNKDSASAASTTVQDAAKNGFHLNSSTNDVTGNVSVEAALIPPKLARTVFGKEVGNNYAVIALTISNRSTDNSLYIAFSSTIADGY